MYDLQKAIYFNRVEYQICISRYIVKNLDDNSMVKVNQNN